MVDLETYSESRSRTGVGTVVSYVLLAVGSVAMFFPFVWMLLSAFKPLREIFQLTLFPHTWTLANMQQVLFHTAFPRWFLNSLVVAGSRR